MTKTGIKKWQQLLHEKSYSLKKKKWRVEDINNLFGWNQLNRVVNFLDSTAVAFEAFKRLCISNGTTELSTIFLFVESARFIFCSIENFIIWQPEKMVYKIAMAMATALQLKRPFPFHSNEHWHSAHWSYKRNNFVSYSDCCARLFFSPIASFSGFGKNF